MNELFENKIDHARDNPSKEAVWLTDLLVNLVRQNNPVAKINSSQIVKWEVDADRMLRIDGRNPEEAAMVLNWCQRNEFWMSNILSMGKFRKQYDMLVLKMQRSWKIEERCEWCNRPTRTHYDKFGACK